MFQYINTHLPADAKIFFIYMKNLGFLCDRSYFSDSMFESYTIEMILASSTSPEEVYLKLLEKKITHLLYDIGYVFGAMSTFSGKEKQLFKSLQDTCLRMTFEDRNRYYLYGLGGKNLRDGTNIRFNPYLLPSTQWSG
jgi:hypothetical protein